MGGHRLPPRPRRRLLRALRGVGRAHRRRPLDHREAMVRAAPRRGHAMKDAASGLTPRRSFHAAALALIASAALACAASDLSAGKSAVDPPPPQPACRSATATAAPAGPAPRPKHPEAPDDSGRARRSPWAELMRRTWA